MVESDVPDEGGGDGYDKIIERKNIHQSLENRLIREGTATIVLTHEQI